jgi:hypothetical protein
LRPGLVAVAVAALAGCGGGGTLSKADFVSRADAICKRYSARIKAIPQPKSPAGIPRFVERALPLTRKELAELRALRPPAKDAGTVRRILDEFERTIEAGRKLSAAVQKNDRGAFDRANLAGSKAARTADRLARAYGFRSCGKNG